MQRKDEGGELLVHEATKYTDLLKDADENVHYLQQ